MNEYLPLLEKLADKLGTTAEHLWIALLKQASISAFLDIVQYVLIVPIGYMAYRLFILIHKKVQEDNWDEFAYIWPALAASFVLMLTIVAFFMFPDTITKLINSEYWALKEILDNVKK